MLNTKRCAQIVSSIVIGIFLNSSAFAKEISATSDGHPNFDKLEEEENLNLQRYNPMYFAWGTKTSKLQISFKYKVVKDWHWYFAYTQVMFWKLLESSRPFQDSTYNPELFYHWQIDQPYLEAVDLGVFEHNSNGKAGADSRSFNRAYARFTFLKEFSKRIARLDVKVGYLYDFDNPNHDIRDYISPFEFRLTLIRLFEGRWFDKSEVGLRWFPGGDYGQYLKNGGYEIGWSFRLGGLNIVPAFYVQYYEGYAESLIHYDEKEKIIRAGFVL